MPQQHCCAAHILWWVAAPPCPVCCWLERHLKDNLIHGIRGSLLWFRFGFPRLGQQRCSSLSPTPAAAAAADSSTSRQARDLAVRTMLAVAAQYICLAHALQPARDIYRKSLSVVRQMLPLPFLRAGYLTAPRARSIGTVTETYRRDWFVLDQKSLRQASSMECSLSTAGAGEETIVMVAAVRLSHGGRHQGQVRVCQARQPLCVVRVRCMPNMLKAAMPASFVVQVCESYSTIDTSRLAAEEGGWVQCASTGCRRTGHGRPGSLHTEHATRCPRLRGHSLPTHQDLACSSTAMLRCMCRAGTCHAVRVSMFLFVIWCCCNNGCGSTLWV
jgi:hypothetical protein